MKKQFIETVIVKFENGKNVITPLVFDIKQLWEMKKEEVWYKYYDEYIKGYILIPFKNSGYYRLFGYKYVDKDLVELFRKIEKAKGENVNMVNFIKGNGILKRN